MALFQFRWLRNLVRKNSKEIPIPVAHLWKRRLSVCYAILAWNAFGFVCYMIYTGKNDWAKYYGYKTDEDELLSPGQHWAKHLGVNKAKIIKFSGTKKISEVEIDNTKILEEATEGNSSSSL